MPPNPQHFLDITVKYYFLIYSNAFNSLSEYQQCVFKYQQKLILAPNPLVPAN